jgi:hypothetical protein
MEALLHRRTLALEGSKAKQQLTEPSRTELLALRLDTEFVFAGKFPKQSEQVMTLRLLRSCLQVWLRVRLV